MELGMIKPGLAVTVVADNGTEGMMIRHDYLDNRRVGAQGTIVGWVPGHGGDVWFVRHGDGTEAAYSFTEIEPLPEDRAQAARNAPRLPGM